MGFSEREQKRRGIFTDVLRNTLEDLMTHDTAYSLRYGLVLRAMHYAHELGFPTGIRIDPAQPDWPVVYIELPTGQVSWHMPEHTRPWDNHTTEQKFERIKAWAKS